MKKAALLPALFLVLGACGSDSGSSAEPSSADTTASAVTLPATDVLDSTAPAVTAAETPLSPTCDGALDEAEDAVAGVMDTLDEALALADVESVDPDEIGAVFEVLGEAVGTACIDEVDGAVSRLITFTFAEGESRTEASEGFATGFIPELCGIAETLSPSAADACATIANS